MLTGKSGWEFHIFRFSHSLIPVGGQKEFGLKGDRYYWLWFRLLLLLLLLLNSYGLS